MVEDEVDQADLAELVGQVARELLQRRLMITLERQHDLLVILGPVGSEEDPNEQLPRLDFRVVAIVQQYGLLDHVTGEALVHLVFDLALDAGIHGAVRVRLRQWPVNRSKPVSLPDPLAELLIFGLQTETGQHPADRVRAIIGDTRHDQRVECFQVGWSQPGGHMGCFPEFPCPYLCYPLADEHAAPGPAALARDGVIGKGEFDQADLAELLGQVMRDLPHRRLMITHERPDDLLVLLGPAGWEEDPDPQLPRLDFRVVAMVQQHRLLDHVAGEPGPHLVIDLALDAVQSGTVHVRLPQSPLNPNGSRMISRRASHFRPGGAGASRSKTRRQPSATRQARVPAALPVIWPTASGDFT